MKMVAQLIINAVMLGMTIYITIYVNQNVLFAGYEWLFLLPLLYYFAFSFILLPLLFYRFNTFIMSFTFVAFLRYTLLPYLIVASGWYVGRSPVDPLPQSFTYAITIMMWELLITTLTIALCFYPKKTIKVPHVSVAKNRILLPPQKQFYWFYLVLCGVVVVLMPSSLRTFAFIMPHANMLDIGEGGFVVSVVQFMLIAGKSILFLLLLSNVYQKYQKTNQTRWVVWSFIIVLLHICLLFGDNRSDFLISAIASLYLFYRLFQRRALPYIMSTIALLFFIFINITTYRNTVSITRGGDRLVDLTDMLQIYAGGPYNVALASELPHYFPDAATWGNLLYDLGRPVMGLNVLFKQMEGFEFSNYLYNYRIYFSDHVAQIIPMIGQGNYYFGFVFAPLLHVGFICFALYLYRVMQRQQRIELVFFLTIPITRLGFMMGQNAGILLNDISFTLLLTMFIYYINNKVVWRKENKS
ncbi:hypothetical protein GCM10007425_05930 [Lysinibacillus alkalisoli]|uniref:Oligosaccharide repeat unit polymerase n=1 Tax=Lysinibacillus alkalisoli TaxID=1911548 RepID=A0A917FYQ8_9BACI|nr:capsule biosynthesis protein CapI [Lysinibacillus alkalisoli]GGG14468.1 hypothetical protein GCM10007425_05930 [Lysinibacillus alkalisoli]